MTSVEVLRQASETSRPEDIIRARLIGPGRIHPLVGVQSIIRLALASNYNPIVEAPPGYAFGPII